MIFAEDIVLLYTNLCNIRCAHCIQESGPGEKDHMTVEVAKTFLDAAYRGNLRRVYITGGEPLLFWEDVLDVLRHASRLGFHSTLVSNAFWAIERSLACERVEELKESGLSRLAISADSFHMEFLPLRVVTHSFEAARRANLEIRIKLLEGEGSIETAVRDLCRPFVNEGEWESHVERLRFMPTGRADGLSSSSEHHEPLGPKDVQNCISAPSLQVTPAGRVYRCCTAIRMDRHPLGEMNPFYFGDRDTFDVDAAEAKARKDASFMVAIEWNILSMLSMIPADHPVHVKMRAGRYRHICDLCLDLCADAETLSAIHRGTGDPTFLRKHRRRVFLADALRREPWQSRFRG